MMYIAPEVHRGEQFDERSDVYSFSIVMWETVSKQAPFADKPLASIPGIVGWGQQRPSSLVSHLSINFPRLICGTHLKSIQGQI